MAESSIETQGSDNKGQILVMVLHHQGIFWQELWAFHILILPMCYTRMKGFPVAGRPKTLRTLASLLLRPQVWGMLGGLLGSLLPQLYKGLGLTITLPAL